MNNQQENIDKGFSAIYDEYEEIDKTGIVVKWMRKRVHNHIEKHLRKSDKILELNAGSGIDAIHFAKLGHSVLATDISEGFVQYLSKKIKAEQLQSHVNYKKLSFTEINQIDEKFDYIFSNFGGLNCIGNLEEIFCHFDKLLNKDGKVSLVIMPKITPWEWLSFFRSLKYAFRRFSNKPFLANIENHKVSVWYHSLQDVKNNLEESFKVLEVENVAFLCPTGANDDFAKRFPIIYKYLVRFEMRFNKYLPKGIGDYYIITVKKRQKK